MGVTRLERKGRKNKTVAKERVKTIKRLKTKLTIASPHKEDSGVVVGDVSDILDKINTKPAKAEKTEKPAKAEKAEKPAKAEKADDKKKKASEEE